MQMKHVKTSLSRILIHSIYLTIISGFLFSCSSQKNVIQWNVELKESDIPLTDKCEPAKKLTSIKTPSQPQLIPASEDREARVKVYGLPCKENEEPPTYEIPISRVKRVTYVSDPLEPPVEIPSDNLAQIEGCCRQRTGWWIFDKFEVKAAIGYRGVKDSVVYPLLSGIDTAYHSSFINFDRGGSTLVFGLEFIGSWNLLFIDKNKRLQAGVLLGLWPVDGSLFVPLGLNLRYTFNQFPAVNSENCNSWYLYGNVGLPFDFNTKAPIIGDKWAHQRFFWGLGFGHDWAINCKMDLSVDVGYRYMNLPLPPYTCCPTAPDNEKYPYRKSDEFLLRVGLTF